MSARRDSVPIEFVAGLATALEGIAGQARDAVQVDNTAVLDLLARHLRHVANVARGHLPLGQQGIEVFDWRLALLRRTVGRTAGVSLDAGNLGYHVRRLGIDTDTTAVSVDGLLTDLAVLAVDERLKAEAARVDGIVQERVDSGQRVAEAEGMVGSLERERDDAQAQAHQSGARVVALERELAHEREVVEFLRGLNPDAGDPEPSQGKPASDAKRRVEEGIYQRPRADGSSAFQARRPDGSTKTFDTVNEAVAWRDGSPVESDDSAGSPAESEGVAA